MESNTLNMSCAFQQLQFPSVIAPVQAAPYMLHLGVGPSLATLSLSIDMIGVVARLACGFAGFGGVMAAET